MEHYIVLILTQTGVQGPVDAEDVAILRGHVVRLGLVARAPDEVDSAGMRRSASRGPCAAR